MALRASTSKIPSILRPTVSFLHSHATSFGVKQIQEGEKGKFVGDVFTNVASNYGLMNDMMSAGLHRLWKDRLIAKLHPFLGMKHLDLAGGTGDAGFCILGILNSVCHRTLPKSLSNIGKETQIFTCDMSLNTLTVGRKCAIERGLREHCCLHGVEGNAEALCFKDGSVDGYAIANGIRNVTHTEKALMEAYRVLKMGGRFLCPELGHVDIPIFKQLYDYYSFSYIPAMGELVAGDRESYQYLVETIRRFPNQTPKALGIHQRKNIFSTISDHSGGCCEGQTGGNNAADVGFERSGFGQGSLVGTVQMYERHIFLSHKTSDVWPSRIESLDHNQLPGLLSAVLRDRKDDLNKRTCLTIFEEESGTDSMSGDIIVFPDMIRYRQVAQCDVDAFVEEVLVKDSVWTVGKVEPLLGSYVFVCAHGSRDQRCGFCGPVLIRKFREEIDLCGLQGQVYVYPCSHIGGHKYAGNVIIFSNFNGEISGHWYGYVSPDNVPILLEEHVRKGKIVDHLWRGCMGLSKEEQKKALSLRLQRKI